jgi:predicted nucleic acid-binding protein
MAIYESAYYDSCIFFTAQNATHREHEACKFVTEPNNIRWIVWVCSELICSETTAAELLNSFEINCALAGALVVHASSEKATTATKANLPIKNELKKRQLKSRDFLHLMCAVSVNAASLLTVDPDFWDASNKSNPKAKNKSSETKKVIESRLPIKILLPSEFREAVSA